MDPPTPSLRCDRRRIDTNKNRTIAAVGFVGSWLDESGRISSRACCSFMAVERASLARHAPRTVSPMNRTLHPPTCVNLSDRSCMARGAVGRKTRRAERVASSLDWYAPVLSRCLRTPSMENFHEPSVGRIRLQDYIPAEPLRLVICYQHRPSWRCISTRYT